MSERSSNILVALPFFHSCQTAEMKTQREEKTTGCLRQESIEDPRWLLPASNWMKGTSCSPLRIGSLDKWETSGSFSHSQFWYLCRLCSEGAEIQTAQASESRSPRQFALLYFLLGNLCLPSRLCPVLFCFLRCPFLKPGLLFLN